jgi:hypothetical protein
MWCENGCKFGTASMFVVAHTVAATQPAWQSSHFPSLCAADSTSPQSAPQIWRVGVGKFIGRDLLGTLWLGSK